MDFTKKVDISKAMTMSLDEYAREAGMYVAPYLKQSKLITNQTHSKFDRIEYDDNLDEEDEDELLQINVNGQDCILQEIKSEPTETENHVTEQNNNNNSYDLRERLNNGQCKNTEHSISNNSFPKANSLQWRLVHPNNTNDRPAGMPPLIPKDSSLNVYNTNQRKNVADNKYIANSEIYNRNNNNNNGYQNHNNNNNNNNNGYRNNNGTQYNTNQNGNNNNNKNNRNRNNRNWNNNRNRPYNNNNQGQNNLNNNNFHCRNQMNNPNNSNQNAYQYYQNNNAQCRMIDGSVPNDLTIKINSLPQNSTVTSKDVDPISPLMSIPLKNPQLSALNSCSSGNIQNPNNSAPNYINDNNNAVVPHGSNTVNLELIKLSSIASTLLDTIRKGVSPQEQKPKYDMKLQKEIHSIQRKPMVYKCPDGEVISYDGPGLNLGVKPTTTGISLNQRFA